MRRDKGDGSIRQKSDKTWEARITINGVSKSFSAKTKAKAKQRLDEYKLECAGIKDVRNQTLKKFIEIWLKDVKYGTIKDTSYDRIENTFIMHVADEWLGSIDVKNVTATDVTKLLRKKAEKLSYSSVRKIHELLNSVFRYALESGVTNFNIMQLVKMPTRDQFVKQTKLTSVYSNEEVNSLIQFALDSKNLNKFRYAPVFVFILNTGIRLGEAIALRWKNIDFDNGIVRIDSSAKLIKDRSKDAKQKSKRIISSTKSEKSIRTIPLNGDALKSLDMLRESAEVNEIVSEYVISNFEGGDLCARTIEETFSHMLQKIGITPKGIHALRHTFATKQLEAGVAIEIVSYLLGHSSVKITQDVYIHVTEKQKVMAVNLACSSEYAKLTEKEQVSAPFLV